MNIDYLKLAGAFSLVASILHLLIIFGGPAWYRFFGAGEQMATMAEQGMLQATVITICIAAVLAIWGAYAWSASGLITPLPFLKPVLFLITSVYLFRGALGLFAPLMANHAAIAQNSMAFWLWSSLICLLFGLVHLKGIIDKWY